MRYIINGSELQWRSRAVALGLRVRTMSLGSGLNQHLAIIHPQIE